MPDFAADVRYAIARQIARRAVVLAGGVLPKRTPSLLSYLDHPFLDLMVVLVGLALAARLIPAANAAWANSMYVVAVVVLVSSEVYGKPLTLIADGIASAALSCVVVNDAGYEQRQGEQDHCDIPQSAPRPLRHRVRLVYNWRWKVWPVGKEDAATIRDLLAQAIAWQIGAEQDHIDEIRDDERGRSRSMSEQHLNSTRSGRDRSGCGSSGIDPSDLTRLSGQGADGKSTKSVLPNQQPEINRDRLAADAHHLALSYVDSGDWYAYRIPSQSVTEFMDEDAEVQTYDEYRDEPADTQHKPSFAWRAFPFTRLAVLLVVGFSVGAVVSRFS